MIRYHPRRRPVRRPGVELDFDGGYRIRMMHIRAVHPHRPLEPWVRAPLSGERIWIGYASAVIRSVVFGGVTLSEADQVEEEMVHGLPRH